MYVEAWAAACRGETPAAAPCFDRCAIELHLGEEITRSVLRKYAPKLPQVAELEIFVEERSRFTRRTFTVEAQQLERLKQRIARDGEAHGAPLRRPPSTLVAVVAMAWTCLARCKTTAAEGGDEFVTFLADVRDRLDPPVGAGYLGTCLTVCVARLPARHPRRRRAGGRGVGDPGGNQQGGRGAAGPVGFHEPDGDAGPRLGKCDERLRLAGVPAVRRGRLWLGEAEADGADQDEP